MKKLKLDILFSSGKQIKKDIPISDEMYEHLITPYRRWSKDVERYVGNNEDKFYDALYDVQTIVLAGVLEFNYGLRPNEWSIADQDYDDDYVSFSIDMD